MKMVKNILLGLVATATILSFAGCKMGAGEGDTDGNKWDLTMTIDTTDPKKPLAEGTTYRRFWEQISASENVAAIKTTITIDPAKCTYNGGALVAGLIFDLNKGTDDKTVDFNLIGINPKVMTGGKPGYYIERYEGVSSDKKKSLNIRKCFNNLICEEISNILTIKLYIIKYFLSKQKKLFGCISRSNNIFI